VISGPPAVSAVVTSDLNTTALTAIWTPTGANIPTDGGKISQITLPGTKSGFQGRDSWVYLPPAYFADNAQPLPVLILLHGQPGGGGDWVTGNRVQSAMNDFAAQHNGIAPVVVMPDVTGSPVANPLCTNSALGQLDTYLAVDVPDAIKSQLRVDPRPEHWGIGGFSYGGTCSMQMVTNHPDVFTSFLDVSGEAEPTLGSHQDTVQQAFGGDESKFKAINPIDIMAHERFPQIAGWFYVGADDSDFLPGQQKMYQAAKEAGMDVQLVQVPGAGHDWALASTALAQIMPWFAHRMGII
jgi:S-formylglutathione hydrolase FrmB